MLGHLAYVLQGALSLPNLEAYPTRVEYDDGVLEDDFIFGAVCNSTSVAGLIKLNPSDVELDDGLFEVLMIRTPKNLTEIQNMLGDVANRNYAESSHILYQKARRVHVSSEQLLAWTVDGEAGGETTEIDIRNCKRAIQILTPKEKEYA